MEPYSSLPPYPIVCLFLPSWVSRETRGEGASLGGRGGRDGKFKTDDDYHFRTKRGRRRKKDSSGWRDGIMLSPISL